MSWKDQAKAAHSALQSRESQKAYPYGMSGYQHGYSMPENPILKVIGQHEHNQDPRVKLRSFRALTRALPIIQRAIEVHRQYIGIPQIVKGQKGNAKAVKVLEEFWNGALVQGQWINDLMADRGIGSFVQQLISSAFEDGSQFFQPIQQASTARVNRSPIEGVRLFDSELFEAQQDATDLNRVKMLYMAPTGQEDATREKGFHEIHFDKSPRFVWGLPISYGAEFFCERYVRSIISYINGVIRKGDPIGITLIGFMPPQKGATMQLPREKTNEIAQLEATVQGIRQDHTDAIKKQRTQNAPQDIVATIPGDVTMLSNYYGSGIELPPQFHETANILLNDIGRSLKTPRSFLGLDVGSVGIGSDMFRREKAELMTAANNERYTLEWNAIRAINSRVLQSYGIIDTPDAYALEWKQPDLTDEKLEAETEKLEAEAVAQQLLNITAIFTELSGGDPTKAVNAYMDEIERPEWKILQPSPEPTVDPQIPS